VSFFDSSSYHVAMAILVWLGAPTVATLLAIVWVHWAQRPRGPIGTQESVEAYERFKAAFTSAAPATATASPREAA
jgi:hypothetical protein